jgi:hypothetical protein
MVLREQWKRLGSWYYIGNSGNEMCSWYNIGKSGKVVFTVLYPLGTVETVMFMVLYWEQWKRNVFMVQHWEECENNLFHSSQCGTMNTFRFHCSQYSTMNITVSTAPNGYKQWKRLCSWKYIGNSGNEMTFCVHGITLVTVETVMFMVLYWEQ